MRSIRKRKPTLQETGMEFDEELGLRFCRQDGHTVHDLNSTRRRTAGIWKIKAASDCGYWADSSVAYVGWGDHTLFGNILRGNSNFKWGEHWGVVTCHDVISAPCKFTQTLINTSVHILHIFSLKGRLSCSFTSIFGHFCVQGFFSYFLSAKQNVKTKEEEREGHREWTLEQWKSDSDQSKIRGSERCRGSK